VCNITEDQEVVIEVLIVLMLEMNNLNELIEAERNYSDSIVENIRKTLLILDKKLRVRIVNNAFYKLLNIMEKETTGSRLSTFL
jgi:two-component system, chemotaxis family, CheB/CheR fusion protein